MNNDRDYIKEIASKLKVLCKMRCCVDDDGDILCDCPFCDNYAYGNVCRITDDYECLPKDWDVC